MGTDPNALPFLKVPKSALFPVFRGGGKVAFIEREISLPGDGELLLRCGANALCASELGMYSRGSEITPGHEAAGRVVAAGKATSTPVGAMGVVYLMGYCGDCRNCRSGYTNQCLRKHADYGFSHHGGYGPYMVVREGSFFPVGDRSGSGADMVEMTVLLDVMGTGGHALKRSGRIHPEPASLLVTGAGPIGLGVLAMAKILWGGDFPVLVTDVIPYRLELARRLGGMTVNVAEEALGRGMARHGLFEVDVAVDASGKEGARREAMDHLAKRGVLVCVGHGGGLSLEVSPDLIAAERAVLGSEYFCYDELPQNLPLFLTNRGYITQIITHRFPVARLDEAFAVFQSKQTGKVVIQQQDQSDGR